MIIVEAFGKLSGLHVQPNKSQLIFLNTAIQVSENEGLPVVPHVANTRYLGHQMGSGVLTDINCAARIRNAQRRLAIATRLARSMDLQVTIQNVIVLPAILFTAAVSDIHPWAALEISNLQKQVIGSI